GRWIPWRLHLGCARRADRRRTAGYRGSYGCECRRHECDRRGRGLDGGRAGGRARASAQFLEARKSRWLPLSLAAGALDRLFSQWYVNSGPAQLWLDSWTRTFSPYEANPLDINPLRDLLEELIDF